MENGSGNFIAAGGRPAGAELAELMQSLRRVLNIQADFSRANLPNDLRVVTIALDGAGGTSVDPSLMSSLYPNGYAVKFPFRSAFVASATDGNVRVNFIPGAQDAIANQGATPAACPLSLKDSMELDEVQTQGLITWANQPGKSITIVFGVNSKVRSGSQVSTIAGGVTITGGSAIDSTPLGAAGTSGSLTATGTAAILCPANSSRKSTLVQITGGSVRVGDSAVAAAGPGNLVPDGGSVLWDNTGELYWILVSGTPVATANEET